GASSVIADTPGRRPKGLFTRRGEGEGIVFHWAKDEKEEARFIAKRLLTLKEEGALRLSDMAIFYRTNAQARPLEEALREARVHYQILKGQAFFERKVIGDLLAYLRLAENASDERAFMRALSAPPRGLGPKALERLSPYLKQSPQDLLKGAGKALSAGALPPKQARGLEDFIGLMEGLRGDARRLHPGECLEKLLERTGPLSSQKGDEESILEFLTLARSFLPEEGVSQGGRLSAFLEHLALASEADSAEPGREAVSLMTLHAAKGLEFPVVFIAGVEDGLIPHRRRGGDALDLAEERRLFYVGMTRAKELLFLSGAEERSRAGRARRGRPSPFLAHIPQELFAEPFFPAALPPSLSPFPRGSRVRHPAFGLGVVKDFKGSGEDLILLVNFESGGQKKLLLKYARLEPA
ncbi:MAG: ATP-dependent helicase, partial [Nitrospinota bacterium]